MLKKLKRFSPQVYLLSAVVLLMLVIGLFYILGKHTNKGSGVIPSQNTAVNTKASGSKPIAQSAETPSSQPASAKEAAPSSASSSSALIAPTGTFVSNHSPSLSGSTQEKAEQSTCNTTPGATCYIKLTKGSIVKTLQSQTTDASGATYWSWNIDDAGLTEGTWTVTAVATLNGQAKTVEDGIALVVQP